MPKGRFYRGGYGSTSVWSTAGETASAKNACARYGLTEDDLIAADPPIECQWRSAYGSRYAVVKLSDVAALRDRIRAQKMEQERKAMEEAEEEEKKAIIKKHGKAYYDKMIAKEEAEAAEEEAAREREAIAKKLLDEASVAIKVSAAHGVADSLEGTTIGKTNAKKDWFVSDLDDLTPVDPSKKQKKYHLSDVIHAFVEASKRNYGSYDHSVDMPHKIKEKPDRTRLYARYLFDLVAKKCDKQPEAIRTLVRDGVKATIAERISKKQAEITRKQAELAFEKGNVGALDGILEPSPGSKSLPLTSPSSKTAKGALVTPAKTKGASKSTPSTTTRNTRKHRNTRNSKKRISNEDDDYEEDEDEDDDYIEPTTASKKRKRTVRA